MMAGASADTFTLVDRLFLDGVSLFVVVWLDGQRVLGPLSGRRFPCLTRFKEQMFSCRWSWPLNRATNPTVTLPSEQNGLNRTHPRHVGDEWKQTNVCLWSTFLLVMPGTHSLFLFKPLWVEAIYYILWRFPRLWILSSWSELWKQNVCMAVCFGSFSCQVFFLFMNKFFIWMSTCMLPLCTHWCLFSSVLLSLMMSRWCHCCHHRDPSEGCH